jgi:ribosomal protein S18 acetylase RimI-like enzyme
MNKAMQLKDGREVLIREMREEDHDRSLGFFQELPDEVRNYLRGDVKRPGFIEDRLRDMKLGRVRRIVALAGDRIVGDGALELAGHGWEKHVGELRLIIAKDYQRQGLGTMMARELYGIANEENMEEIVVSMMRDQEVVRNLFKRFGFHDEVLLPGFVKDVDGKKHDLSLMRCKLAELWEKLEEHLTMSDWESRR